MARFYEKPITDVIDLEFLDDEHDEEIATHDSNEIVSHAHSLTQRPAE